MVDQEVDNTKEESFDDYMKSFKELSLREKQDIIVEELQIFMDVADKMCKAINIPNEILLNRELIDIKKENYTEDDFAEALLVYITSIRESVFNYVEGVSAKLDEINNLYEEGQGE